MLHLTQVLTFSLYGLGIFVLALITRCIYNVWFHPLSKFPGPKLGAASNIWYGLHWTGGQYVRDIDALHQKYGDVVRIAPNDLSFGTLESWKDIYGHSTGGKQTFVKGEWYQR